MSIKDPITYGEHYWKPNVDAQKQLADDGEAIISPYIAGILADFPLPKETPAGIRNFFDALSSPPSFTFLPYLAGVGVNAVDEMLDLVFDPVLKMLKRFNNRRTKETWLTAEQVNTLWSRKKITEGLWDESVASEGYEDALASALYEGQLPYPSIPDVILYGRYHGDAENPWSTFQEYWNISPREWPIWNWLGKQRLTTVQVQSLYKWRLLSEDLVNTELAKIGWSTTDIPHVKNLSYLIPNAMLQVQGGLMQGADEKTILEGISKSDIHPTYNKVYYDAVLTKPASQDIIAYQLRKDPALTTLNAELKRVGIHPAYTDLYKELAYPIPPTADLIMMAVREAFSPEIAVKFGQYEDFPKDFEQYAGMKGISKEWAERYWAAHWNLPSPSQGFEMLHRGVIDRSELDMLLRAQDVMPFWRDKLVQIAYRPLTRVDVRRMYKLGVLDEGEVYEAYLDAGYADENAKRMSEFTVKQTLATQSKFTSGDIVKAFTKRMISRSDAVSLLAMIDISHENASRIIETAEYKREWVFTEQQIKGIRNLYKKKVYDVNSARGQLAKLNLPSDQIEILMQQWHYEVKDEVPMTWTTGQTLSFCKKALITPERARLELHRIGYDTEHINVYMDSIK